MQYYDTFIKFVITMVTWITIIGIIKFITRKIYKANEVSPNKKYDLEWVDWMGAFSIMLIIIPVVGLLTSVDDFSTAKITAWNEDHFVLTSSKSMDELSPYHKIEKVFYYDDMDDVSLQHTKLYFNYPAQTTYQKFRYSPTGQVLLGPLTYRHFTMQEPIPERLKERFKEERQKDFESYQFTYRR